MSSPKSLFGFHAVTVRLKTAPESVLEIHFDSARRDARMRSFLDRAHEAKVRLIESDGMQLAKLCGGHGHQGVVARVKAVAQVTSLDELLENLEAANAALPEAERKPPLLLVLDGVTDPHNLGACLRVADGAGVHAVIAPKDRAVGITATVEKVACGAAETVPYITVTNLARTLRDLQERDIWVVGAAGEAEKDLNGFKHTGALAWVLGAEGEGLRRLTRETCDELVRIPMLGSVESLNVSVSAGICLFEARRQRKGGG